MQTRAKLTKARSSLVRGKVLAGVARRLDLGEMLKVGHGVEESGGREQDSVLAATFEAVIAAVYLDQGLKVAREFVCLSHGQQNWQDISRQESPPENAKVPSAGAAAGARIAHTRRTCLTGRAGS